MSASAASTATAGVHSLLHRIENSLKEDLIGDPQSEYPNQETREVLGAHWVEVGPQPLPSPYLVSVSPAMAGSLGVDPQAEPEAFLRYFSGDVDCFETAQRPWATPYAVSVFGQAIPSPDPFGRGNAYGDGRACSLGEFVAEDGRRWELQLKGSGTTPFSRRGDGRAVLRSSVREYLVSEAMEAMGVPTTRALCLVASRTQYTQRMWYNPADVGRRDHPPDTLIEERCAITRRLASHKGGPRPPAPVARPHLGLGLGLARAGARARAGPTPRHARRCRAAPSFLRVGHVELWSRRLSREEAGAEAGLRALLEHALKREFPEVDAGLPLRDRLLAMLRAFAERQAALSTAWVRVGYVQVPAPLPLLAPPWHLILRPSAYPTLLLHPLLVHPFLLLDHPLPLPPPGQHELRQHAPLGPYDGLWTLRLRRGV